MFNLKLKRVLAAALSAACLLTLASCGKTGTNNNSEVVGDIKDEDTVLTIGGKDINYEEYKYFYLNAKSYTDGDDETYWENNDEAVTKLKEDTLNSIAQFRAIEMLADEMATSREVISRLLKKMAAEGIIAIERKNIRILNLNGPEMNRERKVG